MALLRQFGLWDFNVSGSIQAPGEENWGLWCCSGDGDVAVSALMSVSELDYFLFQIALLCLSLAHTEESVGFSGVLKASQISL